ncbi:MAG: M28 family peptidase, partial [Pseudomonadota bacterium]
MARQRLHFFVIAALASLAVGCSSIQKSPETPEQKQLRQHVAVLASDGFEGRLPGTPGYERAGNYVADVMRAAGLQPAAPAYRQKVPLVAIDPESVAGTLKINVDGRDRVLEVPTEVVFAPPRQDLADGSPLSAAQAAGALVFVGDGIVSPALGLDAYRGVDVRGKIAVIATGNGPLEDKAVAVHLRRLDRKRQAAFARGAVGVLYVGTTGRTPKSTLRLRVTHPEGSLTLADGALDPMPVAAIAGSVFADLMEAAGRDADAVLKAVKEGKAESFALPATAILSTKASASPVDTFNVVGVLPGTDPQLASEAVVITAHLDHLGRGVSHGHPTLKVSARGKSVDNIYNGALDNAAGTAIVLEAASALAASGPHRRTLIFAAVTAEEAGLLGSAYLARNIEALGYNPVANVN